MSETNMPNTETAPLDTTNHLIACLSEECGEVAKECNKALRFGLNDQVTRDPLGPRGTDGPTNREKIIGELNDLMAVVSMLIERGALPVHWQDIEKQTSKKIKVLRYMDYARRIGALEQQI